MKRLITFLSCMVLGSLAMMFGAIFGIVEMFKPVKYLVPILVPILVLGFLLTGCDDTPTKSAEDGTEYKIKTIDGCQYVFINGGNKGFMAHKGDCNNPIHRHNR